MPGLELLVQTWLMPTLNELQNWSYNMTPSYFAWSSIYSMHWRQWLLNELLVTLLSVFSSLAQCLGHTVNVFTEHQPSPAQNTELFIYSRLFLWCPSLQPIDLDTNISLSSLEVREGEVRLNPILQQGARSQNLVWVLNFEKDRLLPSPFAPGYSAFPIIVYGKNHFQFHQLNSTLGVPNRTCRIWETCKQVTCEELEVLHRISVQSTKKTNPFIPVSFQLALLTRVDFLFLKHTVVADKAFPELIASVCKDKSPSVPSSEIQPRSTQNFYQPWQGLDLLWAVTSGREPSALQSYCPISLFLRACPGGST